MKHADIVKPLRLPPPKLDPNRSEMRKDAFREADTLAHKFGMGYLSITGTAKLMELIAYVRSLGTEPSNAVAWMHPNGKTMTTNSYYGSISYGEKGFERWKPLGFLE